MGEGVRGSGKRRYPLDSVKGPRIHVFLPFFSPLSSPWPPSLSPRGGNARPSCLLEVRSSGIYNQEKVMLLSTDPVTVHLVYSFNPSFLWSLRPHHVFRFLGDRDGETRSPSLNVSSINTGFWIRICPISSVTSAMTFPKIPRNLSFPARSSNPLVSG